VDEGDALDIGPPCGNFTLDASQAMDRPVALISGGIGITPMMSMLKTLAHRGAKAPVYFIHAARNSRVHALANEVRRIAEACRNIQTHFCYDDPLDHDLNERRCDSVGMVDLPLLRRLLPTSDAEFYFCGPKPFMAGLYQGLKRWGVEESRIHFEFFGPKQEFAEAMPEPSQRVAERCALGASLS
jgi:nitric oxide dioxygenase